MNSATKFLAAYLSALVAGLSTSVLAARCGPELAERVPVSDSSWIVLTEVYRCSTIDPGQTEVVAEDVRSKERVKILLLNEEVDARVEYLGNRRIRISLPNMVDIKLQEFALGPYEISYRYLPADDPGERSSYQKWVRNPTDPAANEWYEKHILSKIQPGVPRSK